MKYPPFENRNDDVVDLTFTAEVGYSIASGKALAPFGEIHKAAEKLMGRPVWTHEFADEGFWELLRNAFEDKATVKYNRWNMENSN
jgi:hypothetical protein